MCSAPRTHRSITAPGTGETLIADLVTLITTGRNAGVMGMGKRCDEFEKRLDGILPQALLWSRRHLLPNTVL
jgi:hypothetical protein